MPDIHTPTRMKVAGLFGTPNDIRLVEVDYPALQADGIIVRVENCGLCNSEVKAALRGHPILDQNPLPLLMGHEFAGTVIETGKDAGWVKPGQRYVVMGLIPCGHCKPCRNGRFTLCENFAKSMLLPGGFAPYVHVGGPDLKRRLYPIPDRLGFEAAALTEPLACVLNGIERAQIAIGHSVVVLGAGFMGLLLASMARRSGALQVISIDQYPHRLEIARQIGATHTVNFQETDPLQAVLNLTGGADVVIEATGNPAAYENALAITGKGGRVVYFGGTPKGSSIQLDPVKIHYGEIEITGSANWRPVHVERAIELLAERVIDPDLLITHRVPALELKRAMELSATKEPIKIMLQHHHERSA